ncbi:MAG: DUF4296 domain-containing protein [Bacteroidota bacterium]
MIMKYLPARTLLLVFALVSLGCEQEAPPPKDIIAEDTYINLITEFQMAESFRNNYDAPEMAQRLIDSTLSFYGVSYEQFLRSHNYYQRDLQAQKKRYQKAIDRLDQLLDGVDKENQRPEK